MKRKVKVEAMDHAQLRTSIQKGITDMRNNGNIPLLERLLDLVASSAELAARVATSVNDRNYISAHAAVQALHNTGYDSYAVPAEEQLLRFKRRRVAHAG